MHPVELAVFDFDGTLLKSPKSPDGNPLWWFHAHSLASITEAPGFDPRWYLGAIAHARKAAATPGVLTVVLTARPDHRGMREQIGRLLSLASLQFDQVVLKPVLFPGLDPAYKAHAVRAWLRKYPTIKRVSFYDDLDENHVAVKHAVEHSGRSFRGYKAPGL